MGSIRFETCSKKHEKTPQPGLRNRLRLWLHCFWALGAAQRTSGAAVFEVPGYFCCFLLKIRVLTNLSLATTWDQFVLRRARRNTKKHLNQDYVIACVFGFIAFGHLERLSAPPELLYLKSLGTFVVFCCGCAASVWSRQTDSRAMLR
ncbi:hypothetical protein NDU88_003629 [Pleurodeles waltl]|uniref:Uncharacterized protein n=1 Tax=Pleurodeles waltl TaxID=8319 RepID=A0AAV7T648_PLEWA|nr:hypothetical protein NDU88_003629 [Pleurodeles waltl]